MSGLATRHREPNPRACELFQALAALRLSRDPASAENAGHWAVVDRYVRVAVGEQTVDAADVSQDVMLVIVMHVTSMRADNPISAAAWVKTICRRVSVDRFRCRPRARHVSIDDPARGIQLVAPEPTRRELVDAVLAAFETRTAMDIDASKRAAHTRELHALQARAAIRRLALGESTSVIARSLGRPVSADLVSKWVERGRGVLLATISRFSELDPEVADLYAPLADLAARRRVDHGVPRPGRRRQGTTDAAN